MPPRRHNSRNPFPEDHFFFVPLALHDTGLARQMGHGEFKRYVTLLRLANYHYGKCRIQTSLESLWEADGVSVRAAWYVHRKLQERGLIHIEKTKPFAYHLVPPGLWQDLGPMQPKIQPANTLKIERTWRRN